MTGKSYERKAQAALEYLMTYGWGIIMVSIVIGVLIFATSSSTSSSTCTSSDSRIICKDHSINVGADKTTIAFTFLNGTGGEISIDNSNKISIVGDGSIDICEPDDSIPGNYPYTIALGQTGKIVFLHSASTGGYKEFDLKIEYEKGGLTHYLTIHFKSTELLPHYTAQLQC